MVLLDQNLRNLWLVINRNRKWVYLLPEVVQNYNNSIHSVTKMKPIDLYYEKDEKIRFQVYNRIVDQTKTKTKITKKENDLKVGELVRVPVKYLKENRKNKDFKKPLIKWSEPLTIIKILTPKGIFSQYSYRLSNGESFPRYLIQPVPLNTNYIKTKTKSRNNCKMRSKRGEISIK